MSDSDSENEFEGLFRVKDEDEDIFYFESMNVSEFDGIGGGVSQVIFKYSLSHDTVFHSKIVLNQLVDGRKHGSMLFAIGMCSLTWYWMGFATKRIVIEEAVYSAFNICTDMIDFWQRFYRNVLLEFVYLNRMNAADITIETASSCPKSLVHSVEQNSDSSSKSMLLPLGGGKDSLVSWHMALEQGYQPTLMYVTDGLFEYDQSWRLQAIVKQCGNDFLLVRHEFHDNNFQRHCRSYLNPCGHPWAALVLFDSVLMCSLNGIPLVSLGLELSADEGNGVFINGVEVNHQYDKSSEFLDLAGAYVRTYLNPEVRLVSVLKEMWELEITRIFCTHPRLKDFHSLFISCNEPINQNTWCAKCDKCAFMFLLLSSWLPSSVVVDTIFGSTNMLDNELLLPLFEALIGCGPSKPFDCVGTVDEAKAAIHLTALQYRRERKNSGICSDMEGCADGDSNFKTKSLPVVLCSLCRSCGIALDDYGYVRDELTYQEVYKLWNLHDNVKND